MMLHDSGVSLSDLRNNLIWLKEHVDTIDEYMDEYGRTIDKFIETKVYWDACITRINATVECVIRIQNHHTWAYQRYFKHLMPGVKGIRDIMIHQYERTRPDLVWAFMTTELPGLRSAAVIALSEISSNDTIVTSDNRAPRGFFKRRKKLT